MGLEAVRDFLGALILAQIIIAPLDPAESRVSEDFPPGKGRQLVVDTCTACHSAKLVLQNRMTRDNWDETITWMQEKTSPVFVMSGVSRPASFASPKSSTFNTRRPSARRNMRFAGFKSR